MTQIVATCNLQEPPAVLQRMSISREIKHEHILGTGQCFTPFISTPPQVVPACSIWPRPWQSNKRVLMKGAGGSKKSAPKHQEPET